MDKNTAGAVLLGIIIGALVFGWAVGVISKSAWEYNTALRECAQYDQKTGKWEWKK